MVETTLKDSVTTGDIYALQFVLQFVPHQNRLLRQLHDVVRRLLVRLDGHAIAPDPAFRCHTEAVLKNTTDPSHARKVGELACCHIAVAEQ